MQNLPDNSSGIPVVVAGIPTVQTPEGIVSPFPYLNPDIEDWKGEDEQVGFDTDGGVGVRVPRDPDDFGGDEVEEDYDDEDDFDDDGTGFGIGAMLGLFFRLPAPPMVPA